ncbi:MAG: DUF6077 domain-containing protein [Alistipes sp.]|nr:DUF6077 domain-containing protein [Alistipes sp.]
MFVLKGFLVAVATVGVPTILGTVVTKHMGEQFEKHLLADWVFGMVFLFAQLQLMAVPMIIADCRFHTLFYVYVALVVLEVLIVLSGSAKELIGGVNAIPMKVKRTGMIGAVVLLSIFLQAFALSYYEHTDDDDARFVPSAVAAVQKDMMFEENPVTGELLYSRVSEVFKDMVSPWIMLWAVISKLSFIHPAVFMHSVVPLIFIPFSYAVYWLLAGQFFGNDYEKKTVFLGLVSAVNIFSGYSTYNAGAFLLFRIWQGKALFAGIFVPILFLTALYLFGKEDGRIGFREMLLTAMVCCGACLTSGFGIILSALFFGVVSVIYGISRRSIKGMVLLWIALIPCVVFGFLYAFGEKLFV